LEERIGCWIKSPIRTAIKGNGTTPRLCITALGNEFVKSIGQIGIKLSHLTGESASEYSDEDDVSSESTLEVVDKQVGVEQAVILPHQRNILFFINFFH
jgi:hypothetical protein